MEDVTKIKNKIKIYLLIIKMSTPNTLNNYTRVSNTNVSGNELLSNLSGDDVRALNFQDAINGEDPVTNASLARTLTADELVQAATDRLLVAAPNPLLLQLGPDSLAQARSYIRLFNLTSTNQQRVLTFMHAGVAYTSTLLLGLDSGASTNVNVAVATDYASLAVSKDLIDYRSSLSGNMASVVVYATNLTSGSEAVVFSTLSGAKGY